MIGQVARSRDQVLDIGGEIRVREITLGLTQPGEVKAQDGDPGPGQPPRDPAGSETLLATGKAMREQGMGQRRPGRLCILKEGRVERNVTAG